MHTNLITDKKYIGITYRKPEERFGNDGCNYKDSSCFYTDIVKYGWDNFKHEVLCSGLSKEEAQNKERELISKLKSTAPECCYNVHPGGEIPPIMFGKDNPFYGDHRFAGENHPMYGKKHTHRL